MFLPSIFEELTKDFTRNEVSTIRQNEIFVNLAGYEPDNIQIQHNEKTRILEIKAKSDEYDDIHLKYRISSQSEIDSAELKHGLLKVKLKEKNMDEYVKNIAINVNVGYTELQNGSLKLENTN